MNVIEVQQIKNDALRFFGKGLHDKIDKMNNRQIEELKSKINKIKQEIYPSHAEIRAKKIARRREKELYGPGPEVSIVIPYMHTKER